jgi:hypothetical protein
MQSFQATAAGVARALIGLPLVAVSVAHDRPDKDRRSGHRIPAAAALTAFTNTPCVSLLGQIEHGQIAAPAAGADIAGIAGIAGIVFVLASLLSLIRRGDRSGNDLSILGLLAVTFTAQLITGLRNIGDPAAPAVQHTAAIIIVVCFLSGIARAWELIGGQRIGIAGGIHALLRHRRQTIDEPSARQTTATEARGPGSSTRAQVDLIWSRSSP